MIKRSALSIMARLISLVGRLAYVLVLAVINGSVGHLMAIFIPVLGAVGVAKLLGATVAISYTAIFVLVVVFGVLRGLLKYIEQYSNHYIAFKLLAVLRDKIYVKLATLCPAKLESKQKGTILSMLTADIETIEVFYAHTISPAGIAVCVSMACSIFVGVLVSWYLALYMIVAYIIVGIVIPLVANSYISSAGSVYRKSFTSFNGFFVDAIKGSREVVLYGKQAKYIDSVDSQSANLISQSNKLKHRASVVESITHVVIIALNIGMVLLSMYMASRGVGIAMCVVAVVTLMSSYGPVISINALPANLSQTLTSGARLLDLLDEQPQVSDIDNGIDVACDSVQVDNVSFAYDDMVQVLQDITMQVDAGEIVGIMGDSGCGKSTLLKLLLRFWDKDSGTISYNGCDITSINSHSLRSSVTMVSQSTYIFSDSVSNNIAIARQDASREDIITACKQASIHQLIMQLPDGYDTIIGSGGVGLSAGEAQRIGLARAFLSDARLILLDEPTSNVDAINEGVILSSLVANRGDRAVLLVSHRRSTISIVDKIYKFNNGTCVLQGDTI